MFREGRHVEKSKRRSKKYIVFIIYFFRCFLVGNLWKTVARILEHFFFEKTQKHLYCKIHCFVRVAMLKKTSAAVKNTPFFFIYFPLFSRGKSMENLAKSEKTVFVHKNPQKNVFGTIFFSNNSIFS